METKKPIATIKTKYKNIEIKDTSYIKNHDYKYKYKPRRSRNYIVK